MPLAGVSLITDNSGTTSTYGYDTAGRLTSVRQSHVLGSSDEDLLTCCYAKNTVGTATCQGRGANGKIASIQYYGQWGRPSMHAFQGNSQDGAFSYAMQEYDGLGRVSQSYVLVPGDSKTGYSISTGYFRNMSVEAFSGDGYGYSQAFYDVLGRTVKTTVPGKAWNDSGKSNTVTYQTNTANEVTRYGVSGKTLTESGHYGAGELDCATTADPDGHTLKTYRDVSGNVVMERRAGHYDTYYVYDGLNRLRFVLQPKYMSEKNLDYYVYQYEYDGRGRVVKKKLPGCEPVRYWYVQSRKVCRQ